MLKMAMMMILIIINKYGNNALIKKVIIYERKLAY